MIPYLSIIIPAHNEAGRIEWSLDNLYRSFLAHYLKPYEVIVVENGSEDHTELVVYGLLDKYPNLYMIDLLQAGKGLAVRTGMLEASGEWRLMADVDWSMDPHWIPSLLPDGGDGFDVCITTRNGPSALRLNEPYYRHAAGLCFNWLVRQITGLPFSDTQSGFKAFSAAAADDIFRRCHVDGWAFDVEALYIAMLRMYTIKQIPITWQAYEGSKVRVLRDSYRMLRDVLAIRRTVDRATVQPLERFA